MITPTASGSGTPSPAARRALALITALLVVLGAGAVYKVNRHHKPSRLSAGNGSVAKGPATGSGGSTTSTPSDTTTTTTSPTVPETTTSVPDTTTTTAPVAHPGATTTTTLPSLTTAGLTPAANGTYTYAVTGSEAATGATTRTFPSRMTIKVHGAAGVDARTQAVFDVSVASDHSERQIVRWGSDGVSWTFELTQFQFGSDTRTYQGDYSPPMLQIPAQLMSGKVVTGASNLLSGATLERVEDWKVSVLGTETLTIAGQAVPTVKVQVDRTSRPGAIIDANRTTTFWYSPVKRIWVKYSERAHSVETATGFTYDSVLNATLVGSTP